MGTRFKVIVQVINFEVHLACFHVQVVLFQCHGYLFSISNWFSLFIFLSVTERHNSLLTARNFVPLQIFGWWPWGCWAGYAAAWFSMHPIDGHWSESKTKSSVRQLTSRKHWPPCISNTHSVHKWRTYGISLSYANEGTYVPNSEWYSTITCSFPWTSKEPSERL
jgi:hypothetical protein